MFRKLQILVADSDQVILVILVVPTPEGSWRLLIDYEAVCSYNRGWDSSTRKCHGSEKSWSFQSSPSENIWEEIPDGNRLGQPQQPYLVCGLLATRSRSVWANHQLCIHSVTGFPLFLVYVCCPPYHQDPLLLCPSSYWYLVEHVFHLI